MLYLLVALAASVIGALSGIGGGVIIKPLLDLTSGLDIATISLLSSFTVFSMALASVAKHAYQKTKFEKSIAFALACGAVVGGTLGEEILRTAIEFSGNSPAIKHAQNALLMALLIGVLLYVNRFRNRLQFHLKNKALIVLVGLVLGMVSTFIGIGGGPINIVVLMMFFSLDTKSAAVNSLVLILFSQFSKLLNVALSQGFSQYQLSPLLYMIPAGIIGGIIGSTLNQKVSAKQITGVFNSVLVFIIFITVFNMIK